MFGYRGVASMLCLAIGGLHHAVFRYRWVASMLCLAIGGLHLCCVSL